MREGSTTQVSWEDDVIGDIAVSGREETREPVVDPSLGVTERRPDRTEEEGDDDR